MKRLLLLLFVISATVYPQNIPNYVGYVNDFANILSPQTEAALTQRIVDYEKKTSIEIAIVTVNDLQHRYIEEYSIKLAESWRVGKKGLDNGLIMFVSLDPNDRGFRIEVGRGLEGRVTDLDAGRITDKTVQTYFRPAKYDEGMSFALDRLIETTGNETQEEWIALQAKLENERTETINATLKYAGVIIAFALVVVLLTWAGYRIHEAFVRQRNAAEFLLLSRIDINTLASNDLIKVNEILNKLNKFPEGFGAESAVKTVDIYRETLVRLSEFGTTKNYTQEECDDILYNKIAHPLEQSRKLLESVESNKEIHDSILNAKNEYNNLLKKIDKESERSLSIADELKKTNPKELFQDDMAHFVEDAKKAAQESQMHFIKNALVHLANKDYDKAKRSFELASVLKEHAFEAIYRPIRLKKNIKNSEQLVRTELTKVNALIEKAKKSVNEEHVSQQTKNLVSRIADKDTAISEALKEQPVNWIKTVALVTAFISFLNNITYLAKGDIDSYYEEIERQKKAEAERKRREEERREEEERRRRNSYSSNSSYNSGGSSFGGFGGGGFSGGGSTSRW